MGLADFVQYPKDTALPTLTPYNQNNYATTKGSALYQALQNSATQTGGQQAQSESMLPGMHGRSTGDPGYQNDMAIRNAYGALQPQDVASGMGNWNSQQNFNQGIYGAQQNADAMQQQAIGSMLGTGAGAYLGYRQNQNYLKNALSPGSSYGSPQGAYGPADTQYGPWNTGG